jgi:hypothetical protein
MPSDFVILAIFRDKRNQYALRIAIWRPFTRQIEGIWRALPDFPQGSSHRADFHERVSWRFVCSLVRLRDMPRAAEHPTIRSAQRLIFSVRACGCAAPGAHRHGLRRRCRHYLVHPRPPGLGGLPDQSACRRRLPNARPPRCRCPLQASPADDCRADRQRSRPDAALRDCRSLRRLHDYRLLPGHRYRCVRH